MAIGDDFFAGTMMESNKSPESRSKNDVETFFVVEDRGKYELFVGEKPIRDGNIWLGANGKPGLAVEDWIGQQALDWIFGEAIDQQGDGKVFAIKREKLIG